MKAWLLYGLAALLLVAVGTGAGVAVAGRANAGAVLVSAAVAWVVQLVAFGVLVAVRERVDLFVVGWVSGMVLRFLALGLMAYGVTRTDALPRAATLVSLVAFLFLLLLLEPLFLRRGLQTR